MSAAVGGPEALGRQICLRLLTTAPRTRVQLADAMRRRGVPEETADAILDRLTDTGLIDDAAFAKAWVESRHYARGLSRRSLSAELRRRGVDGDDIIEAVETLDPEQEIETARELVARKLRSTRGQPADARARRAASMLARKGYSPGLAFRLIREGLEQEGAEGFEADGLEAELTEAELSGSGFESELLASSGICATVESQASAINGLWCTLHGKRPGEAGRPTASPVASGQATVLAGRRPGQVPCRAMCRAVSRRAHHVPAACRPRAALTTRLPTMRAHFIICRDMSGKGRLDNVQDYRYVQG